MAKKFCPRGHDLTLPGAFYEQHRANGRISRTCRLCKRKKSFESSRRKIAAREPSACPYCRVGNMPRRNGLHHTRNGRRYPCETPDEPEVRAPHLEDCFGDVDRVLQAAVDREIAPPWERHPVAWTDVHPGPAGRSPSSSRG